MSNADKNKRARARARARCPSAAVKSEIRVARNARARLQRSSAVLPLRCLTRQPVIAGEQTNRRRRCRCRRRVRARARLENANNRLSASPPKKNARVRIFFVLLRRQTVDSKLLKSALSIKKSVRTKKESSLLRLWRTKTRAQNAPLRARRARKTSI